MNISEEAGSHPVASAAPLLFQAPQFQEPAPRSATPSDGESATPRAERASSSTGQRRRKAETAPTVDSGAAAVESADDASSKPKKNTRKKTKKPTDSDDGAADAVSEVTPESEPSEPEGEGSLKRRRRRTRSSSDAAPATEDGDPADQVKALKGSTRLEAKRMRRREGRREGRRRQSITEAEFLARRESVNRQMVVRHKDGLDQIAVLEDDLLVEHYVARRTQQSIVGNIYLGRVQNVLPSMEAAFVDIGRGRNAVLYAGEVNWDALGMEGKPRRIEQALSSGATVLVQVTKDPIGHKGARLTSQITLAGRYLVLVPGSQMLGISRKLPDIERNRLKKILREAVPEDVGVIVRTAAEGATEEQLREDVQRLTKQWKDIQRKEQGTKKAPQLLRGEPELVVRVVRDIFNEDFTSLLVQGEETWQTVSEYVADLSPELSSRVEKWTSNEDIFHAKRIDQQLTKGMDRKVWLPSGGTLVIDRTEALTVIDVNTGKFIGSGGTLEETVTRNNLEAAEEIVRQLRLRDIGGIVIIDFVDMVLESNRDLVLRRLVECLGRDRTRHQVTEITSLGLVQMTRKRVGEGLVEAFSTTCEACEGRGFIVHEHPVELAIEPSAPSRRRKGRGEDNPPKTGRVPAPSAAVDEPEAPISHVGEEKVKTALSAIAAATVTSEKAKEPAAQVQAEAPATTRTRVAPAKAAPEPTVEPAPTKPRRRRVVVADPVTPVASPAPEPVSEVASAAAAPADVPTDAPANEPKQAKVIDIVIAAPEHKVVEARPRGRRRVVSSDSGQAPARSRAKKQAAGADEEKVESAKRAVLDLLHQEGV